MAIERMFVKEGIKESKLEEFLRNKFERAGYSHTEIERTPIGTRITVHAFKPGLVIGRSGRRVNELVEEIRKKFGIENPLVDVREVDQPFLDSNVVARRIARAIERGINYKKVANYYVRKVMEAGATGVSIRISGKIMGKERSRFQKFREGFVATSGDYAEKLVDKAYAQALTKLGIVGIQVRIMKGMPKEFIFKKEIELKEEKVEEGKTTEGPEAGRPGKEVKGS